MKERKITPTMQKVAADILMQFMFIHNIDDAIDVYKRVMEQYNLYEDPFTGVPCTPEEWAESKLEYEKQVMIEKYGHCDGLE